MSQPPYVSRPEAEDFLAAIAAALKSPTDNPTVFNAWGIGGVGKSTLTRQAKASHAETAKIAAVSFGLTEGIDEPIPLMAKLYEQIAVKDSWSRDPFWEQYELYFETVNQLSTQAATGRGAATPDQVNQVKDLLKLGVDAIGEFALSESAKKTANTLVDKGMDAAVAGLSLKDGLQQLLQQHKATKRNQELQRLMLEPLPHLTQAFAQGLSQQAQQQPIILVLDTYEKVPGVIDTWLWRTLLGNTDLSAQPVRLLVAGRHSLLKTEGWRKLHQDRDVVKDVTVERFTPEQTQAYLAQIGITDDTQVENICRVTRGLPYYLNWIREQSEKGRTLDFDQGNQEIVRLLLQGLNDTQKRVVQLAACCRWFDAKLIRYLTEQQELDFASAVDEERNCYGWLTQLSFAEPVGKRWRLDDVARDVFRQSLEQDQRECIHGLLADHCLALSDQEVPINCSASNKYENPDWGELRAEYLYHLAFTRRADLQPQFVAHLLDAHFWGSREVVAEPIKAMTAEFELDQHPCLGYATRKFIQHIQLGINHAWMIFGDFLSLKDLGTDHWTELTPDSVHELFDACLPHKANLSSLQACLLNFYRENWQPEKQKVTYLLKANHYIESVLTADASEKECRFVVEELGPALRQAGYEEEAIAAYDAALAIKPDKHEALYNKACCYSLQDQVEPALENLERAIQLSPEKYREMAKTDTDFDAIRDDPRFQALVEGED